jgi:hypothetical protein
MTTRTLGWVQDSADFRKLRKVVQLFSCTDNTEEVARIAEMTTLAADKWAPLRKRLEEPNFCATFPELTRDDGKGLLSALLPGQSEGSCMSGWATYSFAYWAHAFGYLAYSREDGSLSLTPEGGALLATVAESDEEGELFTASIAAYPPAVRILELLEREDRSWTKYELGEEFGFIGEPGFQSFGQKIVVDAFMAGDVPRISDAEGTADKYSRTICSWLLSLKLISVETGDRTGMRQNEFKIAYKGKRLMNHIRGKSKHPAVAQRVWWEMLATKAPGRDHLRNYRLQILRLLPERAAGITLGDLHAALVDKGFTESDVTLSANLRGLQRIGIRVEESGNVWRLASPLSLDVPEVIETFAANTEYEEVELLRELLIKTPEKYLALIGLSVSGRASGKSQEFEVLLMDYLVNALGLPGRWLGGSYKPDGVVHVDGKGVVVDAKAYSQGYPLLLPDQGRMVRYVQDWRDRYIETGRTVAWWHQFPESIDCYTYSFVSGSFKPSAAAGLADISGRLGGIKGTTLRVRDLLETGERLLAEETSLAERIDALFYDPVAA